ncbi:peptidoglycan-binding protein [Streptomyces sp. NPDC056154]
MGTSAAHAATPTCSTTVSYTTVHGFTARIPASGTNVSCVLASGNSGIAVKALQSSLNECYGERLDADGAFGSNTQAALKRAQSQEGVLTDGVYGPRTRDALHWRVVGFACDRVDGPGGL